MAKMYIVSDQDLGEQLDAALTKATYAEQVSRDEVAGLFELIDQDHQVTMTGYETTLSQVLDEQSCELVLFGMAFLDKWCLDDVFIVIEHDSGNCSVTHY